MTGFPASVGRPTVNWDGRPCSRLATLLPTAVLAAAAPLALAWTPGFSTSDTGAAAVAAAVAAALAVSTVPLADRASSVSSDWILFTAALASAGAAAIHFSVIRMHFEEYKPYGVFFVVSGIVQLVWPAWLLLRRWQPLLVAGAIGNAAIVALWILDRVGAMPIGPDAKEQVPFGLGDSVASGFEVLLVVACVAALHGRGRQIRFSARLTLTLGTIGLTTLALLSVSGVEPAILPPAM
ncbi:MAG: hypothetical protein ACJ75G_07000 [Gaiellaceae bacterium]